MTDNSLHISNRAQEFYSFLRNYISGKVDNLCLAEDLTQEVMYRLAKASDEERKIHNTKAWLFQTTRHVIADHYRDKSRNPVATTQSEFPEVSSGEKQPVLSKVDFLIPMIRLLSDSYSRPLLMSDIEGMPQKEVARKMNLGLSATKMRIKRGRQKLRELFTSCCDIEFDANGDMVSCTIRDHCEPLIKFRDELCDETCACSWTES